MLNKLAIISQAYPHPLKMALDLSLLSIAPYLSLDRLYDLASYEGFETLRRALRDPKDPLWVKRTLIEFRSIPLNSEDPRYDHLWRTENFYGQLVVTLRDKVYPTKIRAKWGVCRFSRRVSDSTLEDGLNVMLCTPCEGLIERFVGVSRFPKEETCEKLVKEAFGDNNFTKWDPVPTEGVGKIRQIHLVDDKILLLDQRGSLWTREITEYGENLSRVDLPPLKDLKVLNMSFLDSQRSCWSPRDHSTYFEATREKGRREILGFREGSFRFLTTYLVERGRLPNQMPLVTCFPEGRAYPEEPENLPLGASGRYLRGQVWKNIYESFGKETSYVIVTTKGELYRALEVKKVELAEFRRDFVEFRFFRYNMVGYTGIGIVW